MIEKTWDVLIVGAGPAGSAVAGFLARAGWKVLVLEKEAFPRFHVGESLLPMGLEILHELGVNLADEPYALRKQGAVLRSELDRRDYRVSFEDTLPGGLTYAYQVERAPFDQALAERAMALGAQVLFRHKVTGAAEDASGVTLRCGDKQFRGRYLIDASGQNAVLARTTLGRHWVRGMGRYATFTHYHQVNSDLARETFAQGDIQVLMNPTGWAWLIPLPGNKLSVGVVHKDGQVVGKPETDFKEFLLSSPFTGRILRGASRIEPIHRCSDFSYYCSQNHTARMTTLGDARAFLDPVFSSGVSLSLYAARSISQALQPHLENDQALQIQEHHETMDRGYLAFERIIERFYRPRWVDSVLFADHRPSNFVTELNTIFAGYVWREDNSWQNQMVRAKRRNVSYEPALI